MDLDCYSGEKLVMAVELKDREIRLRDLEEKLPSIRSSSLYESFFLAKKISDEEMQDRESWIERQYQLGYSIYVFTIDHFASVVLALTGSDGRRNFLVEVGNALDEHSELLHRKAWEKIIREI